MSKIIGIDLGTTNSVVAVMEGGQPKVLINESGSRLTPSVVAFTEKGEVLVGQRARNQQVTNPHNTVFSIKRFMGRRHNEVSTEEKMVPFKIVGGSDELVRVHIDATNKDYTPPEISAFILRDLKRPPNATSAKKSNGRSSPCRPTSTTRSARPPRRPARSPACRSNAF